MTGSHSLKGGMQLSAGHQPRDDLYRGDMESDSWNGGCRASDPPGATPRYAVENIRDLGLFIDEKWTLGRFTLSGGLRYDYFNGYAPEQWSPPGTWVPARLTPTVENIPKWTRHQPAPRRRRGICSATRGRP